MISVIIPTLDAESHIGKLCHSLTCQSVSCEIIVIDSQSSDSTVALAKMHGATVIDIKRSEFNHGLTRNLAATKASGDLLVFLTQDAIPADNTLLERLTNPLIADECKASYGRHVPLDSAIPTERFARLFNYPVMPSVKHRDRIPELGIKTFFFSNVCSAIKRSVFDELGGFPGDVILNEDMFFAARLIEKGHSIAYIPEACVIHSHSLGLSGQFKRYFDIGVFFSGNRWLFNHTSLHREGFKMVLAEFDYLMNTGAYVWIPYAVLEILAKQVAYKAGLHNIMLPHSIRKYLSHHPGYWEKNENNSGDGQGTTE
jgi:rhamnosyltransferase